MARVSLESFGPYHQSQYHSEPKLEGESPGDYNLRCWRSHLNVRNGTVHIKARAIHAALIDAAAYAGLKIEGQGNKTWTKKFGAGIVIFDDIDLGIPVEEVGYVDLLVNPQGRSEGGTRISKRLPMISKWTATFDVHILDPIITEDVFTEMLEIASLFIGIGQYRPQNGGTAGRFKVVSIDWQDNRVNNHRTDNGSRRAVLTDAA